MTDDPMQNVIQAVQGFYARKDPAHDLGHALRVRRWAKTLALEEGADVEIVELAALLHDIGRAGAVEKSHAESGASLAASILAKLGYSEEISQAVREAVISHSRESGYEPKSLEAKILYDADKLDFVGPVGLARLFSLAALHGWTISGSHSCEEFYKNRISTYDNHLFTPSARRYFQPLFAYMEKFWADLYEQIR